MPALLSWVLMLGGIATTVAAAVVAAEVEFEVVLAFAGLLATILGAVALLLARVAGDAPADLRPPGASARVNLPTAGAPAVAGRRRSVRRRARTGQQMSGPPPAATPIPSGPRRAGVARLPVLLAAFIAGVAWQLTNGSVSSGPLDLLAGLLLVAAPIALVIAVGTRVMTGQAWPPAVTAVLSAVSLVVGSFAASFVESLLA